MYNKIETLINSLREPEVYPHPVSDVSLIETHISWVFLTGKYVYKIKKPVDMGFLDFSSLEKRHKYCELEVVLNKRLAPAYYLQVVPITGNYLAPKIDGKGAIIEYAVKMRQFPQQAQLDRVLAENRLSFHHMDLLAKKISGFHQNIRIANENHSFGELAHIHSPVLDCFSDILQRIKNETDIRRINDLKEWSEKEFHQLEKHFVNRKKQGFIRECHGDLHLRNIAIVDEEVIAFDGIEFSENLRWNDVMSEIAFLIMDLQDHEQGALASRFLNRYLEISGDYSGLQVLPYYLLYRAIVRAMVSCIRLGQEGLTKDDILTETHNFKKYVELAETYTKKSNPKLFITYGLSGSGKSTVSQQLMQDLPAIRIRSDVERKRLNGVSETARNTQGIQQGIYNKSIGEQTYQHLVELSELLLSAGFSVIVDATFLQLEQREKFFLLAQQRQVELTIIECDLELSTIRQRIIKRSEENEDISDAGLDVLEYQIAHADPLTKSELKSTRKVSLMGDDFIGLTR